MLCDQKARQLADRLNHRGMASATCADPLIILALLGLILSAIQLLYTCQRTPAAMAKRARNLGWLDRWRLGRIVRAECAKHDKLKGHAADVFEAMVELAKETPPHQFMALLRESRQTHL